MNERKGMGLLGMIGLLPSRETTGITLSAVDLSNPSTGKMQKAAILETTRLCPGDEPSLRKE